MNIGSIKTLLIGFVTIATFSGCTAPAKRSFAAEQTQPRSSKVEQLDTASLANGNVILSAPRGYCIDPGTIRRSQDGDFALIARCDIVGTNGFFAAREPVLISVMVGSQPVAFPPTFADLESLVPEGEILNRKPNSDPPMINLLSPHSGIKGASPNHWRSAFSVNGHMIALALYVPEDAIVASSKSARLLSELTRKTRAASQQPNMPTPVVVQKSHPKSEAIIRPQPRPGSTATPLALLGKFAGLFD